LRPNKGKKRKTYAGQGEPVPHIDSETLLARVWALAEPVCGYEGIDLLHIEYQRESRGRILRLYVDRSQGVTLDDCAQVSRQVGDLLDVELENIGPYNLEVSSPGPDRPLSREPDFVRFEGRAATVKTSRPISGRKTFKGVLSGAGEGMVRIRVEGEVLAIPLPDIRSARLIGAPDEPTE